VPGYRAPEDTVGPATRVTVLLAAILRDAWVAGAIAEPTDDPAVEPGLVDDLARLHEFIPDVPTTVLVRGLVAWTQLFGIVNFELFGQFNNTIDDAGALVDRSLQLMAAFIGLGPPR
jgi:hypothetical protein